MFRPTRTRDVPSDSFLFFVTFAVVCFSRRRARAHDKPRSPNGGAPIRPRAGQAPQAPRTPRPCPVPRGEVSPPSPASAPVAGVSLTEASIHPPSSPPRRPARSPRHRLHDRRGHLRARLAAAAARGPAMMAVARACVAPMRSANPPPDLLAETRRIPPRTAPSRSTSVSDAYDSKRHRSPPSTRSFGSSDGAKPPPRPEVKPPAPPRERRAAAAIHRRRRGSRPREGDFLRLSKPRPAKRLHGIGKRRQESTRCDARAST